MFFYEEGRSAESHSVAATGGGSFSKSVDISDSSIMVSSLAKDFSLSQSQSSYKEVRMLLLGNGDFYNEFFFTPFRNHI